MKSCGITSNGRPGRISLCGMSEEEARLAALRAFGSFVAVRQQTHETWSWLTLEHLWQDLRRALRSARRAPLLSSVAVLALALGIGLNTGVFTIVNAGFLRGPTRVDPASFVQIFPRYAGWFTGADQILGFTTEDFEAIRSRSQTLSEVSVWRQYPAVLEQENKYITTLLASCNYFHVLLIDSTADWPVLRLPRVRLRSRGASGRAERAIMEERL